MRAKIIIPKLWSPSSTCPEMPASQLLRWILAWKLFNEQRRKPSVDWWTSFFFFGGVLHKKSDTLGDMKPRQPSAFASTFLKCKNQLLAQTFDC